MADNNKSVEQQIHEIREALEGKVSTSSLISVLHISDVRPEALAFKNKDELATKKYVDDATADKFGAKPMWFKEWEFLLWPMLGAMFLKIDLALIDLTAQINNHIKRPLYERVLTPIARRRGARIRARNPGAAGREAVQNARLALGPNQTYRTPMDRAENELVNIRKRLNHLERLNTDKRLNKLEDKLRQGSDAARRHNGQPRPSQGGTARPPSLDGLQRQVDALTRALA
ncbi:hypothetical protein [Streptomyces qinzhouensis]|uniref:Uncharacterized protein n=1 Tax=Streptomyces qinzhouensis TaxID=2599401 RepID=A0A5B8JE52_9ACTN|nr:hypothetical protein [Streptomyces qinzhouensis]QDY78504.1 hypothetical protein FQU76_20610 [Streptomyces qinzhouensis]